MTWAVLIVVVIIWIGLDGRSSEKVKHIQNTFSTRKTVERKNDLKSYKRNLIFMKFNRKVVPKIAWIFGSLLFGAVSGTGIVPFILLFFIWLIYGDKFKKPNYSQLRKLDHWVVVASQTIINSQFHDKT